MTPFRHSLNTARCFGWYFRIHQQRFLWSDALLCQSYIQTLRRSQHKKARIKNVNYPCSELSIYLPNSNYNPTLQSMCFQRFFHRASSFSTQKKISINSTKDDVEKDENVTHGIVENKDREDSVVSDNERLSSTSRYSSDSIPIDSRNECNRETASKSISAKSKTGSENLPAKNYLSPELQSVEKIDTSNIEAPQLQSKVQQYFLWRYTRYLKKFQESLKNEMPDTFKMLNIFTVGVKEFVIDFKDFIKVLMLLSLPGWHLEDLSHHQLLLYHQMPWDMIKVFPVLLLSSVPFGQNVAFPIGYWFPRHLLCRHFWDIQQRQEFEAIALRQRLYNARQVFRSLQAILPTIIDWEQQEKCREVFSKLGSGIHPSTDEILSLLPLFQGEPFHIRSIWVNHVNGLLRLHGRSVLGLRRRRLEDHAHMLHCMDAAIISEKLHSLSHDTLKTCLFVRGLNPTNMSKGDMLEFMENWLTVSRALDSTSYSLLLHLPIFLAYNQPSNFALIY